MTETETAPGRRIRYRLLHPLSRDELDWARKQARRAHLSLTTWLRRVGEVQRAREERQGPRKESASPGEEP